MSFSFKRAAAAAIAIVCATSMCGCADSGYVGDIEGVKIPNGVYLSSVMSSYSAGYSKVNEEINGEDGEQEITDLFAYQIEEMDAKQWVKNDAMNQIKRFVAVQKLFEVVGLSLTAEDEKKVNDSVNTMWEESDMYAQYIYGTDTMGEYYESVGIGKESVKELQLNAIREEKLFLSMYSGEGEKAVSDDEINTYIKDKYASYKMIELPYDDKYGLNLKEEADIQAVKDKANEYADRLNGGESFIEIQYEHDLANAQNKAAVDAEDNWKEDSGKDMETAIQEAIAAATATKAESVEALEKVTEKDNSSLEAEVTEFIWNLPVDGKAAVLETEYSSFIVVRGDITTKSEWKEDNKLSILDEIKGEEFEAYLDEVGAGYSTNLDSYLIDTKYAPNKIKGINNN